MILIAHGGKAVLAPAWPGDKTFALPQQKTNGLITD